MTAARSGEPEGERPERPERPDRKGAPDETAEPAAPADDAAAAADAAPEDPALAAERFRDRWLRTEAELQNFRRRAARDLEEGRRAAEERIMLEIIAALDDLERALDAAHAAKAHPSWLAGVEATARRMRDALAREGVRVLDPRGEPFDPAFHEAMLSVDAPRGVAPGVVTEVTHKGYARGARVLRPARVVVARQPAGTRGGAAGESADR